MLLSRPFISSRDQDRNLGLQVSRPRPKPGQNELQCTRVSRPWSISRSQHWLHQFQMVTEHSLKGATNYGNRATGVGTKSDQAYCLETKTETCVFRSPDKTETLDFRSRDRDRDLDKMNSSALESRDHGLEITTLNIS